ncbi:hypothetical protein MBCUT_13790 [Methanobrevibacter cuticularis]|uniref:Transposase IS4-like domain-containing protein n=1 Tax=Methanobrevibacter cuticularis TaxID=47311 RepID=A0A166DIK5_9EURY|nr:hypothetical protein [Methanobrevibacter cuticularis]KZX15639.1 hypothetical protein MBCUT_13790 [Methanobrevibacter cuticularis]
MVDTNKDYILSSNITYKDMNDLEHTLFHLNDVKDKINLNNMITIYDRGYNSTELVLKTIQLESYFVIMGKKTTFKKQQEKMKKNNKDDQTFKLSLNNSKIKKFHTTELKKYAIKEKSMKYAY